MSKPLNDDPDVPPSPFDDADVPPAPEPLGLSLEPSIHPAPAAPPVQSPKAEGDIVTIAGGKYRIIRPLGAGGMGEVALARRIGTHGFERDVALKWVLPQHANGRMAETVLKGFVDEARLAATLHHPAIAQVLDLALYEGRGLVMVLEYVEGRTLKTILDAARRKRTSLTPAFACYVAAELAAALDYAHHATDAGGKPLGIVHRDVTPHNIMLAATGAVKLLDFGIAYSALENREATTSGYIKGKDEYHSPEAFLGIGLDGRADEFALGLCLYEMLVGRRFFKRGPRETETQVYLRISTLTPEAITANLAHAQLDESLGSILQHALAPLRDERFATCGALADALRVYSQRRGWLYSTTDAAHELDALFALPDADPAKTNPSGPRRYSAQPRLVPRVTVQLPALTPGRSASGVVPPPPARELELGPDIPPLPVSPSPPDEALAAPSAPDFDSPGPTEPEEPEAPPPAEPPPPSATAIRRRGQLQAALDNPQADAKRSLLLPAAILAATLLVGVIAVKLFLASTAPRQGTVEVLKTPEQVRAEKVAAERAIETASPRLAPLPPAPSPSLPLAPVAAPSAAAPSSPPGAPPAGHPSPHPRTPRTPDAKAVDDALRNQYGGRPVVTADAPQGAIAPAAPAGPRRRSLDSPMIGEFAPATTQAAGLPSLPKGTVLSARLVAAADSSQPAPLTATIAADARAPAAADGTTPVVIPAGATVFCTTTPGTRLGLHCDSVSLPGGRVLAIDAVAFGVDHRVGLPVPRQGDSAPSGGAGDAVRDTALNTARTVLGRVTPAGVAGDVTQGAADGTTGALRGSSRPSSPTSAPAPLVPAGTHFTLFLSKAT
jgi:serine/threonine protein kinase